MRACTLVHSVFYCLFYASYILRAGLLVKNKLRVWYDILLPSRITCHENECIQTYFCSRYIYFYSFPWQVIRDGESMIDASTGVLGRTKHDFSDMHACMPLPCTTIMCTHDAVVIIDLLSLLPAMQEPGRWNYAMMIHAIACLPFSKSECRETWTSPPCAAREPGGVGVKVIDCVQNACNHRVRACVCVCVLALGSCSSNTIIFWRGLQ